MCSDSSEASGLRSGEPTKRCQPPRVRCASGASAGISPIGFSPAHSIRSTMKDVKDKGEGQSGERGKNPRRDRLKLAFRGNLKPRKSHERGPSEIPTAPPKPED